MKSLKNIILTSSIIAFGAMSCKKEGCTDSTASNYTEKAKKDDGSCIYPKAKYQVPSTYAFTKDGNSTVSYGGQTQRLEMLSEITTYMKTANTSGTAVDVNTLKSMYANDNYTWVDADNLGLTGSSKQLKNKTAYAINGGSADAGIQTMFEGYMNSMATISAATVTGTEDGTAGTAGVWPNDGVKGPYLMDADGKEYAQLIEKGLMCAVFMNQITVNYLGGINADNNEAVVDAAAGKHYTKMEHHWDEAYGYFTSEVDYPTNGTNRFWGKYADGRESVLGSATTIATAFRTGRAAIDNKDYVVRDVQITIIVNEMEKVCAGTAIHYLNGAKSNITDATIKNHELSEARAFLNGLRYGQKSIDGSGILAADIDTALGYISDFQNVTISDLNSAIDLIASKTGLDSVKTSL